MVSESIIKRFFDKYSKGDTLTVMQVVNDLNISRPTVTDLIYEVMAMKRLKLIAERSRQNVYEVIK